VRLSGHKSKENPMPYCDRHFPYPNAAEADFGQPCPRCEAEADDAADAYYVADAPTAESVIRERWAATEAHLARLAADDGAPF
jgi:hypothetical protein